MKQAQKRWVDIDGFNGYYQISNTGEVKSVERIIEHSRLGKQKVNERLLRPGKDGFGYLFVYLCKDGKPKMRKVHRLVAKAFIEPIDNCPDINHKDGNKENNSEINLEWSNDRLNQLHAYKKGLSRSRKGKENSLSKAVVQLTKSGVFIAAFDSISDAGIATGIKNQNISQCAGLPTRTAGGFKWSYK